MIIKGGDELGGEYMDFFLVMSRFLRKMRGENDIFRFWPTH